MYKPVWHKPVRHKPVWHKPVWWYSVMLIGLALGLIGLVAGFEPLSNIASIVAYGSVFGLIGLTIFFQPEACRVPDWFRSLLNWTLFIDRSGNKQRTFLSSHLWAVLVFLLVIAWAARGVLFVGGTVGLRDDWPLPALRAQNVELFARDTLYAWNENYLGLAENRQSGNYVDLLTSFIAMLGANGWLISRYPLFLLPLAGYFNYRLLKYLGFVHSAALLGSVLYMLTPFVFTSYIAGYAKFFISYCVFPLFLRLLLEVRLEPTKYRLVYLGLSFALLASQPNFFILGLLVLLLFLGFEFCVTRSVKGLGKLILIGSAPLLFSLLIQPALLLGLYDILSARREIILGQFQAASVSWLAGVSPNLSHAFSFIPAGYTYFADVPLGSAASAYLWERGRLLVPLIALIGLQGRLKSRTILFFATSYLLAVFLMKGDKPPFSEVQVLFAHIPFLSTFRNVSYFSFIGYVGLTVLFTAGIQVLIKRFGPPGFWIGILSVVLFSLPFWSGSFGGRLIPFRLHQSTIRAYHFLAKQSEDVRIAQFPFHQPMTYTDVTNRTSAPGNNPFVLQPPLPSLWMGVDGGSAYQTPPAHAYFSNLFHRGQSSSAQLLADLGVKYLQYDPRFTSRYTNFIVGERTPHLAQMLTNDNTIRSIERDSNFTESAHFDEVRVFENTTFTPNHFSWQEYSPLLLGGYPLANAYQTTTADKAVPIFSNQVTADELNQTNQIIASDQDLSVLPLALAKQRLSIEPGTFIGNPIPDADQHWVIQYINQWWWLDARYNTIENSILTRAEAEVTLTLPQAPCQRCELWVKLYKSPRGSHLVFAGPSGVIGESTTLDQEAEGFRYERIGEVVTEGRPYPLVITSTRRGENVIAELTLIDRVEREQAEALALSFSKDKGITLITEGLSETPHRQLTLPKGKYSLTTSSSLPLTLSLGKQTVTLSRQQGKITDLEENPKLQVTLPKQPLSILDPSFERQLWQTKQWLEATDTEPGAALVSDALVGKGLRLRSTKSIVSASIELPALSDQVVYLIEFFFKTHSGNPPAVAIEEAGVRLPYQIMLKSADWHKGQLFFTPRLGQKSAQLSLLSHPPNGGVSEVLFDEVRVSTLPRIDQLVIKKVIEETSTQTASVEWVKENPTRYRLKVKQAQTHDGTLIFNEAFDRRWKLEGMGVAQSAERIGGWRNSWLIKLPGGESEFIVRFNAQPLTTTANAVSYLTISLLLMYLWQGRKKNS